MRKSRRQGTGRRSIVRDGPRDARPVFVARQLRAEGNSLISAQRPGRRTHCSFPATDSPNTARHTARSTLPPATWRTLVHHRRTAHRPWLGSMRTSSISRRTSSDRWPDSVTRQPRHRVPNARKVSTAVGDMPSQGASGRPGTLPFCPSLGALRCGQDGVPIGDAPLPPFVGASNDARAGACLTGSRR